MSNATIDQFELREQLYSSNYITVRRAYWKNLHKPVILKLFHQLDDQPEQAAKLRYEYFVTRKASEVPGSIKPYALTELNKEQAIVLEDFKGEPLNRFASYDHTDYRQLVNYAIQITKIIRDIHELRIIHKDINPSNILLNHHEKKIKLIDYGVACLLQQETSDLIKPESLEGTLAYISPEQTGRINRSIDYRTDFYSLGVTLYELITGQLPFNEHKAIKLIHAHLAKDPTPPHQINREIPLNLSNIVMKLLAKDPDDRYQSEAGIIYDLEHCLEDQAQDFTIGSHDIPCHFEFTNKLYGREIEKNEILDILGKSSKGSKSLLFISGNPGSGKSSLIMDMSNHKIFTQNIFISGKCEQLNSNLPYASLHKALQQLVNIIQTSSKEQINRWTDNINKKTVGNLNVLTDIFPELESLFGKQEKPKLLNPIENYNRFLLTFINFISAIANKKHPLVLFIDDIQWASAGLINLLRSLQKSDKIHHLTIICAYRTLEIKANTKAVELINDEALDQKTLHLEPLTQEYVTAMLTDVLHSSKKAVASLADLCLEKTGGNPYFLKQFLISLYNNEMIFFDKSSNQWQWDINKVTNHNVADNMISFLQNRVNKLSAKSLDLLKIASCIGTRFTLNVLSAIKQDSPENIAKDIQESLDSNVIVPLNQDYKYIHSDNNKTIEYQFQHDRLRQAIYNLLPEAERKPTHGKIADALLQISQHNQTSIQILEIANHYNKSAVMTTDNEKYHIAKINMLAGCKAKDIVEYHAALDYFKHAIALLPTKSASEKKSLITKIYNEAIEAAYLTNNFTDLNKWFDQLKQITDDPSELITAYMNRSLSYISMRSGESSAESLFPLLKRLGHSYPKKLNWLIVAKQIIKAHIRLKLTKLSKIKNLPKLNNERVYLVCRVLSQLSSTGYMANKKVLLYSTFLLLNLSLKYGICEYSSFGFIGYSLFLHNLFQFKKAYQYAKIAEDIVKKYEYPAECYGILYVLYCDIGIACKEYRYVYEYAKFFRDKAYRDGNIEFTAWFSAFSNHVGTDFYANLDQLKEKIIGTVNFNEELGSTNGIKFSAIAHPYVENLTAHTRNPLVLKSAYCDEDELLKPKGNKPNVWAIKLCYYHKMRLAVIFNEYETALEFAKIYDKCLATKTDVRFHYLFNYFIAKIKSASNLGLFKRFITLPKLLHLSFLLKKWSKSCPQNYLQRYYAVKAELLAFMHCHKKASHYFDLAIKTSIKNHLVFDEALVSELAAQHAQQQGLSLALENYIIKSYIAYQRWGAKAKALQIFQQYREPITNKINLLSQLNDHQDINTPKLAIDRKTQAHLKQFDLYAIIKASESLSTNIELEKLINSLMDIVLTYSGSQKAALILHQKGKNYLSTSVDMVNNKIHFLSKIDNTRLLGGKQKSVLPITIINRVTNSKKSIIIDDSSQLNEFLDDYYIKHQKPKSILCMPLTSKDQLIGCLYLENNATFGAFTKYIVKTLDMLSSEISLSLYNAQLYEQVTVLSESYERFVPKNFISILQKKSITAVEVGNQVEKKMAVMLINLKNFSQISQKYSPQEFCNILNQIFAKINKIIADNNGFVDKYMGDNLLVLFPNSADDAIKSSILIQQSLREHYINDEQQTVDVNIALHYSKLLFCTVGDTKRMDVMVIAEALNALTYIQSTTSDYGVPVIATKDFMNELNHPRSYIMRDVDKISYNSDSETIDILEIIDAWPAQEKRLIIDQLDSYNEAWQYYLNGNFAKAIRLFNNVMQTCQDDKVTQMLIHRCKSFLHEGMPDDWQGTFTDL